MSDFIRSLHKEYPEDAIPMRREGYVIRKIPCCYLLTSSDLQHTLKLNESSLLIWQLSTGQISVGEILNLLAENFPEKESEIKRDVFRVLDELEEENVITVS